MKYLFAVLIIHVIFTLQFRTAQGRLFTCTSAHLPGCHNSTSDFEETLDSLRTVWDEKHYGVIGIGANAQLGVREPTDCAWSIGLLGLLGRDDRG